MGNSKKRRGSLDITKKIVAVAEGGVITTKQAAAAGVRSQDLARRVKSGLLKRERRGVYSLVGAHGAEPTECRAAIGAAGGFGLALWSANHWLGIEASRPSIIHVSVPQAARIETTGSYVPHSLRDPVDDEIIERRGVQVSSAARTMRDFAAVLAFKPWADRQLERWAEEALIHDLMSLDDLETQWQREPTRSNVRARLRHLIDRQLGRDTEDLKSRGEAWLRAFLEERGFPMPLFNAPIPGTDREGDVFFPDIPLILEFDSFKYHGTRAKLSRDARRDRRTLRAGIPTMRVTSDDLSIYRDDLEADLEFALVHPFRMLDKDLGAS